MEVTFSGCKGLPEDAIISIRSGAVRRQGPASAGRPFRFPKHASETDCVVKVDILQNIGSGYVVLRPNETDGKQYEVVLGKDNMTCNLDVKQLDDGQPLDEKVEPPSEDKAQSAKEYMESTGLLQFVQGVLQVVVKQQPADPFSAMAKHFQSGYGSTPGSASSPKAETPAESKDQAAEPAPESPKPTEPGSAEEDAKAAPEPEAKTTAEPEAAAAEPEAAAAEPEAAAAEPEAAAAEPEVAAAEPEAAVAEPEAAAAEPKAESAAASPKAAGQGEAELGDEHSDVASHKSDTSDAAGALVRRRSQDLEELAKDIDEPEAGEGKEQEAAAVPNPEAEPEAKQEAGDGEAAEAPKEEAADTTKTEEAAPASGDAAES